MRHFLSPILFLFVFLWSNIFPTINLSSTNMPKVYISDNHEYLVDSLSNEGYKLDQKLEQLEKTAEKSNLDNPKPKVIVKSKTIVKEKDSASIWIRHPDGSLERKTFSTKNVPIIETVVDTAYIKKDWFLKRWLKTIKGDN